MRIVAKTRNKKISLQYAMVTQSIRMALIDENLIRVQEFRSSDVLKTDYSHPIDGVVLRLETAAKGSIAARPRDSCQGKTGPMRWYFPQPLDS